jgi:molecular chaperone GrpE
LQIYKKNKKETAPNQENEKKAEQDADQSAELAELQNRISSLEEDLSKQSQSFLRLAAEYDNFRKRSERERANIYQDATANAILPILTVADSLKSACAAKTGTAAELQHGLELLGKQFEAALEKLGVSSFGEPGEVFNPDLHNAIAHIEDQSLGENSIVEVFQQGYKIKDKIIRHAVVKVSN